jgi:hypothetical protein
MSTKSNTKATPKLPEGKGKDVKKENVMPKTDVKEKIEEKKKGMDKGMQKEDLPEPRGTQFFQKVKNINDRIDDVNDKNLNRSDFPVKKNFGEDLPPRKSANLNRDNKSRNDRGRIFDRKSGMGLDPTPKKNEVGSENWGDPISESFKVDEEVKKLLDETEENFPEPEEEGVSGKGYDEFVQ